MKNTLIKGTRVTTNRKYKKRFNSEITGIVVKSTHFDRIVVVKSDDGVEHNIKPEFLTEFCERNSLDF